MIDSMIDRGDDNRVFQRCTAIGVMNDMLARITLNHLQRIIPLDQDWIKGIAHVVNIGGIKGPVRGRVFSGPDKYEVILKVENLSPEDTLDRTEWYRVLTEQRERKQQEEEEEASRMSHRASPRF
jgi:hypothetical protein